MMERGAQVSDEDFDVVMDYLLRHYGRINVNKAEAEDLAIVVGVSQEGRRGDRPLSAGPG